MNTYKYLAIKWKMNERIMVNHFGPGKISILPIIYACLERRPYEGSL